jgi:acetyl esterase/lipase
MPVTASLSVRYGAHPEQAFDVVVPDHPASVDGGQALVVALHGGWWHQGHHQDLRSCCLALAEHGWPAASLGFRQLAPPAAISGPEHARSGADIVADVLAGLPKVVEEAAMLGWSGNSIVLLGSGSGSLLALVAASRLTLERKAGVRVRACIAAGVTPSLDHADGWAPALAATIDRFAGRDRHALSPTHLTPHGYPALLLLHGDKDVDVPAALAQKLHQKVVGADESSEIHVLAGPGHHFIESPFSANGRLAFDCILPFLAAHGTEPRE